MQGATAVDEIVVESLDDGGLVNRLSPDQAPVEETEPVYAKPVVTQCVRQDLIGGDSCVCPAIGM